MKKYFLLISALLLVVSSSFGQSLIGRNPDFSSYKIGDKQLQSSTSSENLINNKSKSKTDKILSIIGTQEFKLGSDYNFVPKKNKRVDSNKRLFSQNRSPKVTHLVITPDTPVAYMSNLVITPNTKQARLSNTPILKKQSWSLNNAFNYSLKTFTKQPNLLERD